MRFAFSLLTAILIVGFSAAAEIAVTQADDHVQVETDNERSHHQGLCEQDGGKRGAGQANRLSRSGL